MKRDEFENLRNKNDENKLIFSGKCIVLNITSKNYIKKECAHRDGGENENVISCIAIFSLDFQSKL